MIASKLLRTVAYFLGLLLGLMLIAIGLLILNGFKFVDAIRAATSLSLLTIVPITQISASRYIFNRE